MSKKFTLLILVLAAMPLCIKAQKTTVNVLYLDGTSYYSKIAQTERIEIGNGSVTVVTTDGETTTHRMSDIDKIEFTSQSTATQATTASAGTVSFAVSGSTISVSGAADGTTVTLYNAAGQLVASTTSRGGRATIDAACHAAGAYIIKASGLSQKIIKK